LARRFCFALGRNEAFNTIFGGEQSHKAIIVSSQSFAAIILNLFADQTNAESGAMTVSAVGMTEVIANHPEGPAEIFLKGVRLEAE
jgi:hypothetical protein